MESLIRLVHCLKSGEVQFIRDYYFAKFKGSSSKRLQLFELILQNKITNNDDLARELYNTKDRSAQSHLKNNLFDDILNILLVASNGHGNQDIKHELCCRKKLIQGKILLSRGIEEEGLALLKKTTKLTEKYDFPGVRVACYDILRHYSNHSSFVQYNEKLNQTLSAYSDLLEAKKTHLKIQRNSKVSLETLRSKCADSESKKASYWLNLSIILKLYQQKEFDFLETKAQELLNLIRCESSLNTPSKEANLCLIQAKVLLQLQKYSQARCYALDVLALQPTHSAIRQQALLVLFFTFFREGLWVQAENIYQKASTVVGQNAGMKPRWNLLKGALCFSKGNYKEVNRCLGQLPRFRDVRWQVSARLLEILTILEIEDYDWYEFKFESFRKKITAVGSKIDHRISVIYQVLYSLIKVNFDYRLLWELEQEHINQLCSNHKDYRWNPMGYELINLAQWLKLKFENSN